MKNKHQGKLTVIYGPMFSGKTTYLIKHGVAKQKGVVAFKPDIDKRYTRRSVLRTHDGLEAPAILVPPEKPEIIEIKMKELVQVKPVKTVFIDEVNFFAPGLTKVIERLKRRYEVVASGLLMDSERGDFGPTRALVAVADTVKVMYARCDEGHCENPAEYSYAKKPKHTQVVVGAEDLYGAVCNQHYDALHVPGESESVIPIGRSVVDRLIDLGVYPAYADWLRSIKFPYMRKTEKSASRTMRFEIMSDTFGVGKSNLVKALASNVSKKADVWIHDEDADKNPYYERSLLEGDGETVLKAQKWFVKHKHQLLKRAQKHNVSIICGTPESDFCYAVTNVLLGRISLKQFDEYVDYFYTFDWSVFGWPKKLVYVAAPEGKFTGGWLTNQREMEYLDSNYPRVLQEVHRAWLSGQRQRVPILKLKLPQHTGTNNGDWKRLASRVLE